MKYELPSKDAEFKGEIIGEKEFILPVGTKKLEAALKEALLELAKIKQDKHVNRNRLAQDLTDQFIEYQWRLEYPMPDPNQTAISIAMFQNDYQFRHKVHNWVSGVMVTIDKHIK